MPKRRYVMMGRPNVGDQLSIDIRKMN
jgi:hypothetical protein